MDKDKKKEGGVEISREDERRLEAGAKKFVERYSETIIRLAKENG